MSKRAARLISLFALLVLLLPAPALAHAQLLSQQPADGATVEVSPEEVKVVFDEPIVLGPDGLRVLDSSGRVRDVGSETVDRVEVTQGIDTLEDGWYLMNWGVVSEDGHIVRTSSVFGVGDADASARPEAIDAIGAGGLAAGLARALGDFGIIVAAGAAAAWWLLRARSRAVAALAIAATLVGILGTAAWMGLQIIEGGTAWLGTTSALVTVIRVASLVVAAMVARRYPAVSAVAILLALVSLAFGGHVTGSLPASAAQAAHLLAAAVWLGAAPAVLLSLHDRALPDEDALALLRRFSRTATVVVVVVAAAGSLLALYLSEGLAGGLTTWSSILGVKVALVLIAVGIGGIGRRSLGRQPRRERFRWLFVVDSAIVVAIVILSAALSQEAPEASHADHANDFGDPRCSALVGDRSVAVIADPGRVGSNGLVVSGLPDGVRGVTLHLGHPIIVDAPLALQLQADEAGWVGDSALPLTGFWTAAVVVRVDSFTEARGDCVLGIGQ